MHDLFRFIKTYEELVYNYHPVKRFRPKALRDRIIVGATFTSCGFVVTFEEKEGLLDKFEVKLGPGFCMMNEDKMECYGKLIGSRFESIDVTDPDSAAEDHVELGSCPICSDEVECNFVENLLYSFALSSKSIRGQPVSIGFDIVSDPNCATSDATCIVSLNLLD